jgi:phage/plasmid-like protein (TIGR03299 family)
MAHGITMTDSFAFTGTRKAIWHKMGTQIPDGQTAVQTFPSIGLDWETELVPVFAQVGDQRIALPEHRAHIRKGTNDVFGLVSDGYKSVDNGDLAKFADGLVDGGGATVETAGSHLGGRRVFCTLRLPKVIALGKGGVDENYSFLVVSNGHGGFASFNCYMTSVRVVCQNTLAMSERDLSTGVRFYHTGDLDGKLKQARTIMGLATKEAEKFEQQVRAMANADLSDGQVRDFMNAAFASTFGSMPKETGENQDKWLTKRNRHVEEWIERMNNERNALPGLQGTAWAALNAYTEWSDHHRGGSWLDNRPQDVRQHSNVFGVANVAKRKVFKQALAMVGV